MLKCSTNKSMKLLVKTLSASKSSDDMISFGSTGIYMALKSEILTEADRTVSMRVYIDSFVVGLPFEGWWDLEKILT